MKRKLNRRKAGNGSDISFWARHRRRNFSALEPTVSLEEQVTQLDLEISVIEDDPEQLAQLISFLLKRADLKLQSENILGELEDLERVVALNPRNAEALFKLALNFRDLYRFNRDNTDIDPENLMKFLDEYLDKAIKNLEICLSLFQNPADIVSLSTFYLPLFADKFGPEITIERINQFLPRHDALSDLDPIYAPLIQVRANHYLALGNLNAALADWLFIWNLDNSHVLAFTELKDLTEQLGNPLDLDLPTIMYCTVMSNDKFRLTLVSDLLRFEEEPEEILGFLAPLKWTEKISSFSMEWKIRSFFGEIDQASQEDRIVDMLHCYKSILLIHPNFAEAFFNPEADKDMQLRIQGILSNAGENSVEAIIQLSTLLEENPNCFHALFFRATLFEKIEDLESAAQDYESIVREIVPSPTETLSQGFNLKL